MTDTGPIFAPGGEANLCGGTLHARPFRVQLTDEAKRAVAIKLARAYVAPHHYQENPEARVASRLPTEDTPQRGDFGEFLTHLLYEQILGHQIPFSRLWSKVAPNASQQGADTVSVFVDPTGDNRPHTIETKVRTGSTGSGALLSEIADGVADDPAYLAAAWSAGLEKLAAHPAAKSAYAYSAAHHLALLDGTPPEELPRHTRHAVIITGGADIKRETIEAHWDGPPPVAALSIVIIPGLKDLVSELYRQAGTYTYGQLRGLASTPTDRGSVAAPSIGSGLSSPLDPSSLAEWRANTVEVNPAVEISLWYLAEHDGIARARALQSEDHLDPSTRTLIQVLLGHDKVAHGLAAEESLAIEPFIDTLHQVLGCAGENHVDVERIQQSARSALLIADDDLRLAVQLVADAVCFRLPRQPSRLLRTAGITGSRVHAVAEALYKRGVHALWPSQTSAIEAGLLASPPAPFVLRVPTSGGKTTLIALAAANALDHCPGSRVVVLAPSRALVNQLRSDLRPLLPGVDVLALHGELELGDELPSDDGDVVTIMTPERFDLDWRRTSTVDELDPIDARMSAVVVDEAHYIADATRGPSLELALSRVLRIGIPVTLASSQLGDILNLGKWVGGEHVETNWQPAHHIRQIYYRDIETTTNPEPASITIGVLIDESEATQRCLTIASAADTPDVATKTVGDQGAALATQFAADGPVVLFSATKKNIPGLVQRLHDRIGNDPPSDLGRLKIYADKLPVEATEERELLLAGVGVHHRDVRQRQRRIVEDAARAGDLRYLVCTSTLLEGVDFATRTVIMVYPQYDAKGPGAGVLRNLEGRAGRGGQHTSGRFVVFTPDRKAADRMLQRLRRQLPPTASQLARAANHLQGRADTADLGPLEPFLLAAIAEAALTDGALRNALEQILGRSLHFAALDDTAKDALLAAATTRATTLRATHQTPWLSVAYRTGLPQATCAHIRDRLKTIDLTPIAAIGQEMFLWAPTTAKSPTEVLTELLSNVVIDTDQLRWPKAVEQSSAEHFASGWLNGTPAATVAEGTAASENEVERCFDALASNGP